MKEERGQRKVERLPPKKKTLLSPPRRKSKAGKPLAHQ
jgi:hypothetical protein